MIKRGNFLYRDGENYKFPFEADVPERHQGIKEGDEIEYEKLGYDAYRFHKELVKYPYDPDSDHNIVTFEGWTEETLADEKLTEVSGSAGSFLIDKDGNIIKRNHDKDYDEIHFIDVEEFRAFYNKDLPSSIDILDLGYWTVTNSYEGPDMEWRRDFAELINTGEIQGMILSEKQTKLLTDGK